MLRRSDFKCDGMLGQLRERAQLGIHQRMQAVGQVIHVRAMNRYALLAFSVPFACHIAGAMIAVIIGCVEFFNKRSLKSITLCHIAQFRLMQSFFLRGVSINHHRPNFLSICYERNYILKQGAFQDNKCLVLCTIFSYCENCRESNRTSSESSVKSSSRS